MMNPTPGEGKMRPPEERFKKRPVGYYRPTGINPNWIRGFVEYGDDWRETLDELCQSACGVEVGASDQCQRNAKHVHAHLLAAFYLGLDFAGRSDAGEVKKAVLDVKAEGE